MKWQITCILLLLAIKLQSQNIDSLYYHKEWWQLGKFNYSDYKPVDLYKLTGEYKFPWSSYVIHGQKFTQTIAINIVVTHEPNEDELAILQAHKYKIIHDLWAMWMEMPAECYMLSQIQGQRFQIHRPGQIYPMFLNYKIIESRPHVQLGVFNGWHVRLVPSTIPLTGGEMPIAIKRLKDINGKATYMISAALFMILNH